MQEQEMSQMLRLQETGASAESPPSEERKKNTQLLDADDHVTPEQIKAQMPPYRNPILRTISAFSIVGGIFWLVFNAFFGGLSSSAPKAKADNKSVDQKDELVKQQQQRIDELSKQNSDLIANNLTLAQRENLKKLKSNQLKPERTPPAPQPARVVQPAVVVQRSPTPQPQPRIIYRESRPIYLYREPPPSRPLAIATPNLTAAPAILPDPNKQWLEASNDGSFRSGSASSSTNYGNTATNSYDSSPNNYKPQTSRGLASGNYSASQQLQSNYQAQNNQSDQPLTTYQPINNSPDPSKQVMLGTRSEGRVEKTISWSGSSSPHLMQHNVLIRVTKSLKAADGQSEVIPSGSYLVAQIINADNTGLLQLSVVSVHLSLNGQVQMNETPLPTGAIQIFDHSGRTLQAKYHTSRTGRSFLSKLSDVAGIADLASSYSRYALNTLQGSRQDSQPQPVYFSLDQGTSVQLYVDQSFALSGVPYAEPR